MRQSRTSGSVGARGGRLPGATRPARSYSQPEAALALCYHVATRRLRKAPEDYAACFATLAEADLVPSDLSERLQQMARFRNLLVHIYWKLDYGRVYDIIQRDIGDLRQFGSAMSALI